jgi:hypothetical protein
MLDQDPEVQVKVLVSLPSSYPTTTPPQLQLLDRYLGPFGYLNPCNLAFLSNYSHA